jgi:hypothetical protein
MKSIIEKQVKLPVSVAFGVVMQGFRIRLGRSLVTLMGVVLGIAFLMSILTGQNIRQGVSRESVIRAEVARMLSFLTEESGPVPEKILGIIRVGPLSRTEKRFLQHLVSRQPARLNWYDMQTGGESVSTLVSGVEIVQSTLSDVAANASGVVVIGEGELPAANWQDTLALARQPVIGFARPTYTLPEAPGIVAVELAREMRPEEVAEANAEARKAAFRTRWIIIISLLVTVIGVSNAMLMSVTERFREIGTMKCLGALSSFVRQMFFIESSLLGLAGSLFGALFGTAFSVLAFGITYGLGLVAGSVSLPLLLLHFAMALIAGVLLSVIAAIYPANFASKMVPATALRSNI